MLLHPNFNTHAFSHYLILSGTKVLHPSPKVPGTGTVHLYNRKFHSRPLFREGTNRKIISHFRVPHCCAFLILANSADNTEAYLVAANWLSYIQIGANIFRWFDLPATVGERSPRSSRLEKMAEIENTFFS